MGDAEAAEPGPHADASAVPARRDRRGETHRDMHRLSDAELIERYYIAQAVRAALHERRTDGEGDSCAMARANLRNAAELMRIVDDLVRRVTARPMY